MVERRMDQALVLRFYFDDYSSQLHRLSKSRNCINIQLLIVHWKYCCLGIDMLSYAFEFLPLNLMAFLLYIIFRA